MRRVPLDLTIDEYEDRLAAEGAERRELWERMPDAERRLYVQRMQECGGDPPELLVLLHVPENREAWGYVPWIVQREYCLWINSSRIGPLRQRRARVAIRDAPLASMRPR